MNKIFPFLFLLIFASFLCQAQNNEDSLLTFIAANKSRSSLYLVVNDSVTARLNENKVMPLASTVKILVAIEFAKQAGAKVINGEMLVPLKELEKYHLPNTDGGAHPRWIEYEKKQQLITDEKVKLIDVARGMIMFSSNANTEYLMDLLGLDNVRNNLQLLRVKQHTAVYPLVASLFLYQNPRNKKEESILKEINKLSDEQYSRYANGLHNALKYDSLLKSRFRPQDLTLNMQKVWSNRLPSSTTKEYAQIANVLNNRRYFDAAAYAILSNVLESVMENPANQQWLRHAGMKGGSTAWVLTKTLYATTREGRRIELAYFFNELEPGENKKLQGWMNDFELKILNDAAFRKKTADLLH
jgi:D-alanyl-D-alanine carboxypeptidase